MRGISLFVCGCFLVLSASASSGPRAQVQEIRQFNRARVLADTGLEQCASGLPQGATVDVHLLEFDAGRGGRSTSGCHRFPSNTSSVCSFFLGDRSVYMPDLNASSDNVDDLEAVLAAIELRTQLLFQSKDFVSERCFYNLIAFSCLTRFPFCDEGNEPMKFNVDVCTNLYNADEGCGVLLAGATELLNVDLALSCDATVRLDSPQYFFRPNYWIGTDVWATSGGLELVELENLVQESLANSTGSLEKECNYPRIRNEEMDECQWPEAFPAYSKDEWRTMRLSLVVPALLSIPLNIGVLIYATRRWWRKYVFKYPSTMRRSQRSKSISRLLVATLLMAILFASMTAFPALIFGNEVGSSRIVDLKYVDSQPCIISKARGFVLLAFVNCIAATLFKVWVRVKASKRFRTYHKPHTENILIVFCCFALPLLLALAAFFIEDRSVVANRQVQKWQFQYVIRNTYSCDLRFKAPAEEIFLLHAPLLLSSFVSFVLSIVVAVSVGKFSVHGCCNFVVNGRRRTHLERIRFGSFMSETSEFDSSSSTSQSNLFRGNSDRERRSQRARPVSSFTKKIRSTLVGRTQFRSGDVMGRVGIQMVRFAIVLLIFLVFGFIGVVSIIPKLSKTEADLFVWSDCSEHMGLLTCINSVNKFGLDAVTCCSQCADPAFAEANRDICPDCTASPETDELFSAKGRAIANLPRAQAFIFYNLSWSMLPLLFGIVFIFRRTRTYALFGCICAEKFGCVRNADEDDNDVASVSSSMRPSLNVGLSISKTTEEEKFRTAVLHSPEFQASIVSNPYYQSN